MKTLRNYLFLIVCCIFAATAFTACTGDSDDNSIDPTTYKSYLNNISGNYIGKMVFYKTPKNSSSTTLEKYDSISYANWKMSADSTITFYNFPVSKVDSVINVSNSSSESTKQLFEALKNCPPTTLKAFYGIPSKSYISSTYIAFIVNPTTIELTLNYGGASHKVYLVFTAGYYMGMWLSSNKTTQIQAVLSGVYVDSTTTPLSSDYINNIGVIWTSK